MNIHFERQFSNMDDNAQNRLEYKRKLIDAVSISFKFMHKKTLKRYKRYIWEYILSYIRFLVLDRENKTYTFRSYLQNHDINTSRQVKLDILYRYMGKLRYRLKQYHKYLKFRKDIQKSVKNVRQSNRNNKKIILISLKSELNNINDKIDTLKNIFYFIWKRAKMELIRTIH